MISSVIYQRVLLSAIAIVQLSYTGLALVENCQEGEYKYLPDVSAGALCVECPQGTFMPQNYHIHTQCFNCTKIEDPQLEVLIKPCSKTRDTNIQCIDGYYRRLPRNPRENGKCLKCQPCIEKFYEIRRCQNFSDTWCCADVNYDFEYNKYGVAVCRERPWMCRRGQYLDTSIYNCRNCPPNTFMPVDYHSFTECFKCQNTSDPHMPLNSKILQHCNSTHPTVIGCEEGFYINHTIGFRKTNIGCFPCKNCGDTDRKFVGRDCDVYKDTVCCDQPNMTVVGENTCIETPSTYGVTDNTKVSLDYTLQNSGILTDAQTASNCLKMCKKHLQCKEMQCDEKIWLFSVGIVIGMLLSPAIFLVFGYFQNRRRNACETRKNMRNTETAEDRVQREIIQLHDPDLT